MIGLSYIQTVRHNLTQDQSLILAGCFSGDNNIPIVISGDGSLPTPDATYKTCAMEADMRIWRHIAVVKAQKILVYSPDTDVYNVGIAVANQYLPKDVIVQINVAHSRELRYVHIKNVLKVQEIDSDLASLPQNDISAILHMLFVVSGCDYISYFMGFGKGMFLNTFYQFAEFISGKNSTGYLCHITEDSKCTGFLSFLRLIGSLYFKKHYSAVVSLKSVDTPQQLFNSFPSHSKVEQHEAWYNAIRSIVSDRITNEEERMPTTTAMWRHWIRSCWVSKMWQSSTEENPYSELPPPQVCGWIEDENGEYTFDWECAEVHSRITDTISFLTKGCSCKKGCQTNQCGCRKKGNRCGPGCQCQSCRNAGIAKPCTDEDLSESETESEDKSSSDEECITTEIVTDFDEIIYSATNITDT